MAHQQILYTEYILQRPLCREFWKLNTPHRHRSAFEDRLATYWGFFSLGTYRDIILILWTWSGQQCVIMTDL